MTASRGLPSRPHGTGLKGEVRTSRIPARWRGGKDDRSRSTLGRDLAYTVGHVPTTEGHGSRSADGDDRRSWSWSWCSAPRSCPRSPATSGAAAEFKKGLKEGASEGEDDDAAPPSRRQRRPHCGRAPRPPTPRGGAAPAGRAAPRRLLDPAPAARRSPRAIVPSTPFTKRLDSSAESSDAASTASLMATDGGDVVAGAAARRRPRAGSCGRAPPSAPPSTPPRAPPAAGRSPAVRRRRPRRARAANGGTSRPAARQSREHDGRVGPGEVAPGTGCRSRAGELLAGSATLSAFTRSMYSPERVSTLTRSPSSTNSGTCTTAPVSSVAGFRAPVRVSPFAPGSVWLIASTIDAGRSTEIGTPSWVATCASPPSVRNAPRRPSTSPGTWSCS